MLQSNSSIFCNSPWYELHIYWDGSLGICCQEDHKLYSDGDYNIARMSIADWFNSEPVQKFRQQLLGNTPVSACRRCYIIEEAQGHSRRYNSNQKSVIFRQAFAESFEQSPGRKHFNISGVTKTHPIDIHIDLGNYCNLACKMCDAKASSTIASQNVKWGIESSRPFLGTDWTRDAEVWEKFKQQLLTIPGLNNIHLMGGETLLTDRFEDLLDTMIKYRRFDICFSFVTNGTVFKPRVIEKLAKFRRVGIEVSIETVDEHNAYQRQGTNTQLVLDNIDRYISYCNNSNITVCLRPAISALTIGYYSGLLEYAYSKKLIIKHLLVNTPKFLDAIVLPEPVKEQYIRTFDNIWNLVEDQSQTQDYNASDLNNYVMNIKDQIVSCKEILQRPMPVNYTSLHAELVNHCRKWDSIYNYNAKELYPELSEIWDQHAY